MNSDPELIQIALLMAAAGHDFVQISKSTGLTYQEAYDLWQKMQKLPDAAAVGTPSLRI
jgi:hypothetical protein